LGLHNAPRRETFDDALVDELKRFQKDINLRGDGVLDLATVLALADTPGVVGPQLIPPIENATKKNVLPTANKTIGNLKVGG
jgi:murein L,D-transpeptidase YcbB/YkuD